MTLLWQPATVVSADTGRVRLQFDRISQCERCLRGEGCGAGVFSQLFSARSTSLELPTDQVWAKGQRVRIGVRPDQLTRGAMMLYGWPLSGFLIGALIGHRVAPTAALGDLSALFGGLLVAALAAALAWRRRQNGLNPVIEALSCDSSPNDA